MVNKGFLFATSSRKIKSHVVESQITLIVWPCLNQLQKNIAQLITWSFLMIKFYQCSIWGFCRGISMFLVSTLAEKNPEVIKFLGKLKNMSLTIKYIFVQERKAMFCLINYFCLSHNFQTWFHIAGHLLYYPHMSAFSFHTFLVLGIVNIQKMPNLIYMQ